MKLPRNALSVAALLCSIAAAAWVDGGAWGWFLFAALLFHEGS